MNTKTYQKHKVINLSPRKKQQSILSNLNVLKNEKRCIVLYNSY